MIDFSNIPRDLAVAVSGGKDSIALLHMLVMQGFNVVALHVNHNTRPENESEAQFVKNFCQTLNVPCYILVNTVPIPAKNFEKCARDIRYDLLSQKTLELGLTVIATAHHQQDVVETIFLKLFRGSTNLFIPRERYLNREIKIIRPLLSIPQSQLLSYVYTNDLIYKEDPTNSNNKFQRNFIRNLLLPLLNKYLPNYTNHLIRVSDLACEEQEFICRIVSKKALTLFEENICNIDDFLKEDIFLQKKILIQKIWNFTQKVVTYRQIDKIITIISDPHKKSAILLENNELVIYKKYEKIIFSQKRSKELEKNRIIVHNNGIIYQNAPHWNVVYGAGVVCEIDDLIELRSIQVDDTIPWNNGHKTLMQWLKDKKILTESWAILRNNEVIGVLTEHQIYVIPSQRTTYSKGLFFTKE